MYGFEALVRRDIMKDKPQGELMALKHYDKLGHADEASRRDKPQGDVMALKHYDEPGHADVVYRRDKPQGDLMSLKHYDEPGHAHEVSRRDRPQGDLMALKHMASLVMQTRCLEGTSHMATGDLCLTSERRPEADEEFVLQC